MTLCEFCSCASWIPEGRDPAALTEWMVWGVLGRVDTLSSELRPVFISSSDSEDFLM